MSMSDTPNLRDAKCCSHCGWAMDPDPMERGVWCSHGVPTDPNEWPDWTDREESMSYNRCDLMNYVDGSEVCDAWKPRDGEGHSFARDGQKRAEAAEARVRELEGYMQRLLSLRHPEDRPMELLRADVYKYFARREVGVELHTDGRFRLRKSHLTPEGLEYAERLGLEVVDDGPGYDPADTDRA